MRLSKELTYLVNELKDLELAYQNLQRDNEKLRAENAALKVRLKDKGDTSWVNTHN